MWWKQKGVLLIFVSNIKSEILRSLSWWSIIFFIPLSIFPLLFFVLPVQVKELLGGGSLCLQRKKTKTQIECERGWVQSVALTSVGFV